MSETKSLPVMDEETRRKLLREQEILALKSHVKMLEDIDAAIDSAEEAMSFPKASPLLVPLMVVRTMNHRKENLATLKALRAKRTEFYETLDQMIVELASSVTTDILWE